MYGESKIAARRYKRKSIYDWTTFEENLGYSPDESPGDRQTPPVRNFRAYIEEGWEPAAVKKNNQTSEAKLLKKYGGIKFKDDNDGVIYTIDSKELEWKRGRNGGWMAICKPPKWEESEDPDDLVPWKFTEDLIFLIKNTPQDEDMILNIINEPVPGETGEEVEAEEDNNEDA